MFEAAMGARRSTSLNDPLLSTKEAAKYLGVCTETIIHHCDVSVVSRTCASVIAACIPAL
jgi:hypothetical protein